MNTNEILGNVELEIKKYIDISTIFKKLKEQGSVQQIYQTLFNVFADEHEFTTNELKKLAGDDSFNFLEHYKLNSSIFKANLTLILQTIIDEIWTSFIRMELNRSQQENNDFQKKNPELKASEIKSQPKSITQPKYQSTKSNSLSSNALQKHLENSKSREKLTTNNIQPAYFSNINQNYAFSNAKNIKNSNINDKTNENLTYKNENEGNKQISNERSPPQPIFNAKNYQKEFTNNNDNKTNYSSLVEKDKNINVGSSVKRNLQSPKIGYVTPGHGDGIKDVGKYSSLSIIEKYLRQNN